MMRCTSEDKTKVSVSPKVQQDLHQPVCSHLDGKLSFDNSFAAQRGMAQFKSATEPFSITLKPLVLGS